MKIKVGDTVIVISGSQKDKQKKGKVLKIFKNEEKILVEGMNIKKKITRDTAGKKTMVDMEFPIHVSNVMFFDEKAKKGTRIGSATDAKGNKVRIAKASGTELK
jgi:large subunit ribosomal protein L24